ncbi:MAG: hypothetical protein ABIO44_11005 [Saprospiraceae bacterium]
MIRILNLLFCLVILSSSCQKAAKKDKNSTNSTSNTVTSNQVPQSGSSVKLLKADEDFIKLAGAQKPYPMITDSIWCFYFALSLSEKTPTENIYQGHWLDIKEDGSYSKGIYDKTTDEGKYVYDYTSKTLEFRSLLKDTSSQWAVKVDPDAMLLIGTERFNNKHWQIKLLRKSSPPSPNVALKNEKKR